MANDLRIEFHREALEELEQAKIWYEQQKAGLGELFFLEVQLAVSRIRDSPSTWPRYLGSQVRRFLLHRFPFAIVYLHESDLIRVLAVMHMRREPGYWKRRTAESS